MAKGLSQSLRSLLSAMNLGRSQGHPLAGWILLSMLYRDGSTASEPMTMNYLVARYNGEYLDPGESRVASETLHGVMKVLVEQAHLVTSSTRRVRERMDSGRFHTIQSSIYRINAAGIEYLKAMQRVIDAENTVVASTKRIGEYVVRSGDDEPGYLKEEDARNTFQEWDNIKYISEVLIDNLKPRKIYDNSMWAINLRIKELFNNHDGERMNFGVVITLKEMNGINRIQDFIQLASLKGWLVNRIDLQNRIDVYTQTE